MDSDNKFCVYEHIRLDNNQCFYVGKGTLKRAKSMVRNEHHNRIVESVGAKVNIIKDNLTESEAYELEKQIIHNYVFKYGYGIDIIGYNNNSNENGHLTNHSFGGDGSSSGYVHSDQWKKEHSERMMGENNPSYGINYWDSYSEDKKNKLKQHLSNIYSGKNNPMYGISPKERMDKETYKKWLEKRSILCKGEKNPNFANDTLYKKLLNNPELKKEYYSRPGGQNGRSQKIELYDIDNNYIKEFECVTYCAQWIKDNYNINSRITSMITSIKDATLNNRPYKKLFRFKFIE